MNQLGRGERELADCIGDHSSKTWAQLYLRSIGQDIMFDRTKWNWPVNTDLVMAELKKGPLVVFMAQDPYNSHEVYVVNELSKLTDDFVVLTGNGHYFSNPTKHICYFPYTFLTQKLTFEKDGIEPIQASDAPRSYAISSLSGKSRYHRIKNYIKLREKPYFNKLLVTMHNNFDLEECKLETPIEFWDEDIIKKFQSLLSSEELQQGHTNDHSIIDQAYTDSYINYVTETSISTTEIYQSEKTWKTFMAGQLGIWLANPGHVSFLRSIGFDVFDDIIKHLYDLQPNLHIRINMIHNALASVMSKDLEKIWKKTVSRRQSNLDLFYSSFLEESLTKQCKDYQL